MARIFHPKEMLGSVPKGLRFSVELESPFRLPDRIQSTPSRHPDVPEVDYWWRKCRIGAQDSDGFAEVLTGGGWRAVTRQGASSGEGCMNYDLDMPPYVQQMADWLDDEKEVHPCNFESAYQGFEIMIALCRSAALGGQVALPLTSAADEIELLRTHLSDEKVMLSSPQNAKEYQ